MKKHPPQELAQQVVSRLPRPGLFKRLLVNSYDALLVAGLVLFAAMPLALIPEVIASHPVTKVIKSAYLLMVVFGFYGWFWVNGGQTLGMKVWNLYVVDDFGKYMSWRAAVIRFCCGLLSIAALGLGFAWILLNRERRGWHDYASGTHMVKIKPKQ